MGVFKALSASIKGVAADQWKEFFICESLPQSLLMTRGFKVTGSGSSNTSSDDNVITDGSVVALADGQCAIITRNSKVVAVCKEPGENIYSSEDSPGIFGSGIKKVAGEVGRRFTFGGDLPYSPERVYYINTKEIVGIPFSLESPIPFRMRHDEIGADIDCSVEISGVFSIKVTDPEIFYKKIAGNIPGTFPVANVLGQIKAEFLSALQKVFGELTAQGLRVSQLPGLSETIAGKIRETLNESLEFQRGISVMSIALEMLTLTDKDGAVVKQIQYAAVLRDPAMAAGALTAAMSEAMPLAAANSSGTVQGFAGMSLAGNTGASAVSALSGEWTCSCGQINKSGSFCGNCGNRKP